jgi:beta-galactosidase
MDIMKKILINLYLLCCSFTLCNIAIAASDNNYSVAGFYQLDEAGRQVYNFNLGWRFHKGASEQSESNHFDDATWPLVNLPHSVELVATEASGSVNYQGEMTYRKHFKLKKDLRNKRVVVHFEAIMGKSKIFLNGKLLSQHYGGFLPVTVDISKHANFGANNIITVIADNSNDPLYPPGKPQETLDFTYFGGMYRDSWLIVSDTLHITDANQQNITAGGGQFVSFDEVSKERATVKVKTHINNASKGKRLVTVHFDLLDAAGKKVASKAKRMSFNANEARHVTQSFIVSKPELWSPQSPTQYQLLTRIEEGNTIIDGVKNKVGIRSIDFRGEQGLFINGEAYQGKLNGVNRHQDFAYLGNALPNSGQWRDAVLLKRAGVNIVRSAHYPMDPAFMDACDKLGIFVIVATPGWQFWNKAPIFEKRVLSDIQNMVRRDRNRASVLIWEPILNETWYPDYFAKKVHELVHAEYPYPGAFTASDEHAKGSEYFDVLYAHPVKGDPSKGAAWISSVKPTTENIAEYLQEPKRSDVSYFTREWGDNVDDWSSHNSPSRVAREWGESAQLTQAIHYAGTEKIFTSLNMLQQTDAQYVGGTLWHAFDHQRGYHPDPFYGGITDGFRQPKYSYELFASQRPNKVNKQQPLGSGPVVYIAHEMTPFSPADVTVFSNCDAVHLTRYQKTTYTLLREGKGGFNAPFVFKDVFDFMDVKRLHRSKNADQAKLQAECIIDDKVVSTDVRYPSARVAKLTLRLADEGLGLVADGSDVIPVIAELVDERGVVKRLTNDSVVFEVSGAASIVGNNLAIGANPRKLAWGSAPVLLKADAKAGEITVKASISYPGANRPLAASLTFASQKSSMPMLQKELAGHYYSRAVASATKNRIPSAIKAKVDLQEVMQQQAAFESGGK